MSALKMILRGAAAKVEAQRWSSKRMIGLMRRMSTNASSHETPPPAAAGSTANPGNYNKPPGAGTGAGAGAGTGGSSGGESKSNSESVFTLNNMRRLFVGGVIAYSAGYYFLKSYETMMTFPKGRTQFTLQIEKLDDSIASYQTSFTESVVGKSAARNKSLKHKTVTKLARELEVLTAAELDELLAIGKKFKQKYDTLNIQLKIIQLKDLEVVHRIMRSEEKNESPDPSKQDLASTNKNKQDSVKDPLKIDKEPTEEPKQMDEAYQRLLSDVRSIIAKKLELELDFVRQIHGLLMKNPKMKDILKTNSTVVDKLKNRLSGLQDLEVNDPIFDQIYKVSVMPSIQRPRGKNKVNLSQSLSLVLTDTERLGTDVV